MSIKDQCEKQNVYICWHKNRQIFQGGIVESPEMDIQNYIHLADDKDVHWRMESFFHKCCWVN